MSVTAQNFMWPFQAHFQSHAQAEARAVLHRLSPDLEVRLFLVGFEKRGKADQQPICVVPDDCEYQPVVFSETQRLAEHWGQYDPARDGFRSQPQAQSELLQRIAHEGLRRAVAEAVRDANGDQSLEIVVSSRVVVDGYDVLVVLQLSGSAYARAYRLDKSSATGCWAVEFAVSRSLIHAAANEILNCCVQKLSGPDPGKDFRTIDDHEELLRRSAKRMMDCAALAGCNPDGMYGKFKECEQIAALLYEGAVGMGRLFYIKRDHAALRVAFTLNDEVLLSDAGGVRKALQMASGRLALLCDSYAVYALGDIDDYDPTAEDVFEVRFDGQFCWQLLHAGNVLMRVANGKPQLADPGFPKAKLARDLPRLFASIHPEEVDRAVDLADCIAAQKHGAMLVISANAADEAERLAGQCTRVKPFPLTREVISLVSSIDGAVLVDLNGDCHAIGVILDGMAHSKCTPGRGARYNSAVRYAYSRNDCVVISKSEDGIIDVVPSLRPLILRSDLNHRLEKLREMSSGTTVERKVYYSTLDWLHAHRFYLRENECAEINELWPRARAKVNFNGFEMNYDEFIPSTEMNDTFFDEYWRVPRAVT